MRFLIAAVLSVLLVSHIHSTPVKNLASVQPKGDTARAATTEKVEQKTQQPQAEPKPEITTAVAQVATPEPTPTVTGCEAYRNLISQYSWNVEVAIDVCNAESSGDASNDNPGDYHQTCMGSRGLFQIGCDSTDNYAGMFDPAANIAQAYRLYASRGWQPWGSTTCRYKVACY